MKSLLISSIYFPPQIGGISNYMASIVKCLGPEEICCLAGVQAGANFADTRPRARIYRRPMAFARAKPIQALMMGAAAAEIMIRERPDVVQLATAYDGYLGLHLQRWLKLPYVVYAHGNEILNIAGASWQKPKLSLQRAARVLANSNFTASLVADLGVATERIVVLHPGCDADLFRPRPVPFPLRQQLLGDHQQDRVILTIGNLVPRKGHDMVIRALPLVLQQIPNVVYLIVGDGVYRAELEKLASDAGVRSRVIFAGRLRDEQLPDIYALANVFAMPSRMRRELCDVEGFGMVYLEASACGKPIIAGRCGGVPEAVADGNTGFLVNPAVPDEVASSLRRILGSPELARKLGEQGRERVLREFTWGHFAGHLREILRSAMEERNGPVQESSNVVRL